MAGDNPGDVSHSDLQLAIFPRPHALRRTRGREEAGRITSVAKRTLDLIGAGLAVLLLGPLMAMIAVAIRLDSPGPALFRQRRVGLGGRTFQIYKFRTMIFDAEARLVELERWNESRGGVLFKIRDDPRITRTGRFLRRTSLDELPQLFNILRGEMSLVGPRPLPLRDCDRLQEADEARYHRRLGALPGLTGPWQVSGRSRTGFDDMLNLDLEYIEHWTLGRDLRLLLRTFPIVVTCRGAC